MPRARLDGRDRRIVHGGLVADALTDVPGSSGYFLGGIVAYADAVKTGALDVPTT